MPDLPEIFLRASRDFVRKRRASNAGTETAPSAASVPPKPLPQSIQAKVRHGSAAKTLSQGAQTPKQYLKLDKPLPAPTEDYDFMKAIYAN